MNQLVKYFKLSSEGRMVPIDQQKQYVYLSKLPTTLAAQMTEGGFAGQEPSREWKLLIRAKDHRFHLSEKIEITADEIPTPDRKEKILELIAQNRTRERNFSEGLPLAELFAYDDDGDLILEASLHPDSPWWRLDQVQRISLAEAQFYCDRLAELELLKIGAEE